MNIIDKPKELVIMDFDGTIIPSNSFNLFIKFITRKTFSFKTIRILLISSLLRKMRFISSLEFKNNILKIIDGKSRLEIDELMYQFSLCLQKNIKKDAIEKINYFRNRNATIVIISGALYDYLIFLKKILNADEIIATKLAYNDDLTNLKIYGLELLGSEKVNAYNKFIKNSAIKFNKTYFYTDSTDDLPLLRVVNEGIFVSGNKKTTALNFETEVWN